MADDLGLLPVVLFRLGVQRLTTRLSPPRSSRTSNSCGSTEDNHDRTPLFRLSWTLQAKSRGNPRFWANPLALEPEVARDYMEISCNHEVSIVFTARGG